MERKSIATNMAVIACDVCGRTLLRGENADVFLHQGSRRMVCELCTARAVHEGWLREGLGDLGGSVAADRGGARSLLHKLRHRRDQRSQPVPEPEFTPPPPPSVQRIGQDETAYAEDGDFAAPAQPYGQPAAPAAPPSRPARASSPVVLPPAEEREPRELRNVHAVPTNAELKVGRALEVFNASPHPRTVAGVARSLGAPIVSARPSRTEGAIVTIVVGWELSWYRYEIDLGDEAAGVRVSGQGSELTELDPADQTPNAAADGSGALHLVTGVSA